MSPGFGLGVDHFPVDGDVENPFDTGGESQRLNHVLVALEKICSRAHGAVGIVSGDAVGDVDDVQEDPFVRSQRRQV